MASETSMVSTNPAPSLYPVEWIEAAKRHIVSLQQAKMLPEALTPDQALLILKAGHSLGLNEMESLRALYAMRGHVRMYAQGAAMIAQKSGIATWEWLETSNERARVRIVHRSGTTGVFEFTIEDAKRAGLAGRDTYKAWTADMLANRALARGLRLVSPELFAGMYDEVEMKTADSEPEAAVNTRVLSVSEDGEVVIEAGGAEGPLEAAVAVDAEPKPILPVRVPPKKVMDAVKAHGATDEDVAGMAALAWAKIGVEKSGLPEGTSAFETPEQQDEWERRFWKAANRWAKDNPQAVEAEVVE